MISEKQLEANRNNALKSTGHKTIEGTSENLLERFHRYKGQIDKTLYKAIHELQRLQSTRFGQHIPAPQALDIDVSSGDIPI